MQTKGTVSDHTNGFAKAFGTYNRYRRTLRYIYRTTIGLLQTNSTEFYFPNHQKNDLKENQHALLSQTSNNALTFVLIGQSYECKCLMVNKLFGQDIIPVDTDWVKYRRTIMFKYGPRPQISVSLPDSFLIIEPELEENGERNIDSLAWKEEFKMLENDMSKISNGLVEITLHHPILRGSKVILCGETENGTYENLRHDFVCYVNGSMPLFLYAINQLPLTETDEIRLNILKEEFSDSAIFFSLLPNKVSGLQSKGCKFGNAHCDKTMQRKQQRFEEENDIANSIHTIGSLEQDSVVKDLCNLNNSLLCRNVNLSFDANILENGKKESIMLSSHDVIASDCLMHNLSAMCNCMQEFTEKVHFPFDCVCKKLSFKSSVKTESSKFKATENESTLHNSNHICTRKTVAYTACDKSVVSDERLKNVALKSVFTVSNHPKFHSRLLTFTRNMAKYYLVRASQVLHNFHLLTLNDTIDFVFDLIRDLSITPRRVEYVREKEFQLYTQLNDVISHNQTKIQTIIENAIIELHEKLLNLAQDYPVSEQLTNTQLKTAKLEIQEMVLSHIKAYTAEKLNKSIQVLRDSFVGTLMRCLQCLESSSNGMVSPNDECASKHFTLILNTAYNLQITVQSSSSFVNVVIDKLRQVMPDLSHQQTPIINDAWKRNAAEEILKKLSPNRLAKLICAQFQAKLNHSHAAFLNALRHLELAHKCRLDNMAGSRHKIARVITPAMAKLALESTSLIDGVLFGMPRMEREIGRGMYGVVYSCASWGLHSGCAVKSVAPPDEKHFNDLSLEFYYTRKLPKHPRVVQIHGSVIDDSYNSGIGPPAVLLIMERLHRDLYTSIKIGMSLCERTQVAVDVVEGIRYLHSQGLVHRDIKLKNVLLDRKGRAKITDLGFCKPGAMISGSIVGTPIHMPPELFSGNYSFSVDVYAFGILMWYLMAGTTRLPQNFELYTTKDHLWTAVRKGIRPERLQSFSEEVWDLMRSCWASNPDARPLLGVIEPKLKEMHTKSLHFSPK